MAGEYAVDEEEITRLKKTEGWEYKGLLGYGASLPDWRDMILSTDKEVIRKEVEKTYNATKVRRKQHGAMFYLKPAE